MVFLNVRYHIERDAQTLRLLDEARSTLPGFCNRFFLGIAQTTAPLTRLGYARDLRLFFEFLAAEVDIFIGKRTADFTIQDLVKIEAFHVELFADWLTQYQKEGQTICNGEHSKMRKVSCLRSFFAYFFKKGEIPANILPNIDLPKLHEKSIIRLDGNEAERVLDAVGDDKVFSAGQLRFRNATELRDHTILMFFLSTGVRISELVGLNIGDIDMKNTSFKVTRKGGAEAILYMSDELYASMENYLAAEANADTEPLFKSIRGDRISVRAVQYLVKKYAKVAVPLKKITPHKLRSTFGTNLYRATKDIYVVADVLGHRDVNTTKKHYAALSEDIRKEAAKKIKVISAEIE